MLRKLSVLLLLVCAFASVVGLAQGEMVVDGMGREVAVPASIERVVSLTPANTEILFALGCADKVVGVDSYSDYPAEALALESKIGDYYAPNVEAIVALEPDVVFASTTLQATVVEQLEGLGLTVVCNDPTALLDVVPGIELIAKVMGVDPSAVVDGINNSVEAAKTKVYFALSFGEFGNYTAGPGTFVDDILQLLRCENVAHESPVSWPEYTLEQLIADDPDVIIVSSYAGGEAEQLMQEPGYSELRCVKAGHVYEVDANITSRPGPRIGEAINLIKAAVDKAK